MPSIYKAQYKLNYSEVDSNIFVEINKKLLSFNMNLLRFNLLGQNFNMCNIQSIMLQNTIINPKFVMENCKTYKLL